MGMEVNKLSTADMNTSYRRLSDADAVQLSAIHLEHGPHDDSADANSGSTGELSGIYFGILNSKSPFSGHIPIAHPCSTPRCLYYFGGGWIG